MRKWMLFAAAAAALVAAPSAKKDAGKARRLLYVSEDKGGLAVYDIDQGHTFVRRIELPGTGAYKGIAASVQLGHLYLSPYKGNELIALDLATDRIVWRKKHGDYPDSMMVTPDGQTLYVPYRNEDSWYVIRARDGELITKIPVGRGKNYEVDPIGSIGPHNTWINPKGTRVYMEVLTLPYVFIADTRTNQLIGKAGPFSKGVRPFTVSDDEKYVFANVDALLGFEVGAVRDGKKWGGRMLHRVEAKTPPERLAQVPPPPRKPHSTPSHGINIRPDQKEVWVVDGVYGYVYAYDVTVMPPKFVAAVPLFKDAGERPHPGWISFSLDGRYAYPDGGAVIDAYSKQVVARIPTSEKLIEIDFLNGKPVKAGHR
ncbi:MAG: YncE family protein [Acidobacteria bacterium]|nr:YncE family protein [Acidobacteriota bacterium]